MLDFFTLKPYIPNSIYEELLGILIEYRIITKVRLAHFMAQCSHESGNFKNVEENLNYSESTLLRVFPKYFNPDTAKSCARNPKLIANKVYANRLGNGPEDSGDGWKYRGRGFIQLTGKNNYAYFDKVCEDDIINNPDLVATKYALKSSAWFWHSNGLNDLADRGMDVETIRLITRRINGGYNGLVERVMLTNKFHDILK